MIKKLLTWLGLAIMICGGIYNVCTLGISVDINKEYSKSVPHISVAGISEIISNSNSTTKVERRKPKLIIVEEPTKLVKKTEETETKETETVNPKTMYAIAGVNIRQKPNVTSQKLGYLNQGESCKVFEQNNGWSKIKFNNSIAYISSEYLSQNEPVKYTAHNYKGITLTQSEINMLAGIVWLESRGEPDAGQQAVVEVILNRMRDNRFPSTLYGVLSANGQFESWKNISTATYTDKEINNINLVLSGCKQNIDDNTVYFATRPLTSNIDKKIGGHYFCR